METLGTPTASYTLGDGSTLSLYEDQGAEAFEHAGQTLQTNGWQLYASTEQNGSRFATYCKGEKLYHLYLTADKAGLRVVSASNATLPQKPTKTTGDKQTTLTQLCLPQTDKNVYSNGMGYVVRLADGSFLLFDGGYAEQADQLWNTLVDQNGGEEGIVIRAWCITHSHGDHYGILSEFANKYASKLTLEYFFAAPVALSDAKDAFLNNTLPTIVAKYAGAKLCVPHTGMTFAFCNLTLEILFAPDELYVYGAAADFNSSGVVYRLTGEGDSMLFLGDAMSDVTDRLSGIWGNYLQTNMVQVAHHGVGSSTAAFYKSLNAKTLFYPAGYKLYKGENGDFGEGKAFADNWRRNGAVRRELDALGIYEILLHDETAYQHVWGSAEAAKPYAAPEA